MSRFFSKEVHGLLVLDKPVGMSSNRALQSVRKHLRAKKAGHTGTLDPLARGVLPLCFGEATKFAGLLLDADKTYLTTAQLGVTTDTGDAEGQILSRNTQAVASIDQLQMHQCLKAFTGCVMQIPPMYSALKHQGQPLYKLARAGQNVPRAPRPATIFELTLLDWQADLLTLRVRVSKGTYIRTLVEDIGQALGVGAHVRDLCREASAGFKLNHALELDDLMQLSAEQIQTQHLYPVSKCVASLPRCDLSELHSHALLLGQSVQLEGSQFNALSAEAAGQPDVLEAIEVGIFGQQQQFLGLGLLAEDAQLKPKRLVASQVY